MLGLAYSRAQSLLLVRTSQALSDLHDIKHTTTPNMPGFLPKKFPGKLGSSPRGLAEIQSNWLCSAAEPMIPFYAAGLIVLYAINSGANAMMACESSTPNDCTWPPWNSQILCRSWHGSWAADEFKNDPRNPNAKIDAKPSDHWSSTPLWRWPAEDVMRLEAEAEGQAELYISGN